jgi:hypothetical protein
MADKPEPVSDPKAFTISNDPSVGGGVAPREGEPLKQARALLL